MKRFDQDAISMTLRSGGVGMTLVPGDLRPPREPRPIRDPLLAKCPLFSRMPPSPRHLLNLLMFGPLSSLLKDLIDAYEQSDGCMTCRGPLRGEPGVHPHVALKALCLNEIPPVVVDAGLVKTDLRDKVPWKERAPLKEVYGWGCHRYLSFNYRMLTETVLFDHLSDKDKTRSVKRSVERVANKLRDVAASMGVTIDHA